jgi:excisionase family DNA binding protein
MPKLMTVAEVAKVLGGVSTEQVRRWVRSGALKACRLGLRMYRIDEEDVRAFLAQRTASGPSTQPPVAAAAPRDAE